MTITVVGAGGKTTVCKSLGAELARRGNRVLFTTTTQIYRPDDCPVFTGDPKDILPLGRFMAAGRQDIGNGKLKGFSGEETDQIEQTKLFEYILVEGDGAKGRPVKAPAEWEPVYPGLTGLILGVIGLDCIGKPVTEENVHRSELFMRITGTNPGNTITYEHLLRLIRHPLGLFRHAPEGVQKVVILNKTDTGDNAVLMKLQQKSDFPIYPARRDKEWSDDLIQRFITR